MKNITKILIIFFAVISFFGVADITSAFTIDPLGVCAVDIPSRNCYTSVNDTFNVPTSGTYNVSGLVSRGVNPGSNECQAEETFDLVIDGQFYARSTDPNACETTNTFLTESFPSITLSAGQHTIRMVHILWNQIPSTAESVGVTLTFTPSVPSPPTCAITATPSTIDNGQNSRLNWSSSNATSMTINRGIGNVNVNGSRNVSPSQTTVYTATVTGPGGIASCRATVTVNPILPPTPPTCALVANPSTIDSGDSTTLTLSSSNSTTASVNQGIGNVPVNGSFVDSPSQTTVYTATVTGPGGIASCRATVTVDSTPPPPAPTCIMSANPTTINVGQSATLSWASTDTTTVLVDNGVGNVPTNGSAVVSPNATTVYTGTFTGPSGSVTCNQTITVIGTPPPAPTCTIDANPSTIVSGDSSTLNWSSTNATGASIDNGIGVVTINGSNSVSPLSTTTYIMSVTGPGGSSTCQTVVNVSITPPPAPTCTMNVSPASINLGDSSTLAWTSTNAFNAVIDNGIGNVVVNDSTTVSPNVTTNYIGTFTGSGGVVTCNALLTVGSNPPTQPAISIVKDDNDNNDDTQTISSGGTATFSVVVTNIGNSNLIDVFVTDAQAPNCDRTVGETASLYPGLTFDPGESFSYTCTDPNVTASYTNSARVDANEIGTTVTVNDTDTTAVVVGGGGTSTTCTIGFNPSSIDPGDVTTLSWSSTNAISASIDQGVGSVNTSGSMDIFRTSTATYTGTFVGPSETVTCSAIITVGGGGGGTDDPRITLSSESFTEEPSYIYLSQIPYTGIPQALIAFLGYFFRFFFFGGLLYALYKIK